LTRSDDWIARSQAEEGADVKPRRRACAGDRCRGDFGRTNLKSRGTDSEKDGWFHMKQPGLRSQKKRFPENLVRF